MKTVILDGKTTNPGDLSWDFLKKYGEVEIFDRTPREKIVERTHDADIVVTNKTPLTRAEIDKMQNVKFVALLSTGYNVVDCAYLKEKGIPVSNIPAYSTMGVAQLVFAFISELAVGVARPVKDVGFKKPPAVAYHGRFVADTRHPRPDGADRVKALYPHRVNAVQRRMRFTARGDGKHVESGEPQLPAERRTVHHAPGHRDGAPEHLGCFMEVSQGKRRADSGT